jgi:hypothetical protein
VAFDAFNIEDIGLEGGKTKGTVEKMHAIINMSTRRKNVHRLRCDGFRYDITKTCQLCTLFLMRLTSHIVKFPKWG